MDHSDVSCKRAEELGLADVIIQGDATKSVEVLEMIEEVTDGELCDTVINNVNIIMALGHFLNSFKVRLLHIMNFLDFYRNIKRIFAMV
ncbi:MAG: L-erythro-3,5-diaminohexanoate dehydrogenase [Halanaerobiales bacterium]|nr:L-erythro-3,5-diaminohexanoate dehydrogenase [Halanaerobiales bacterium]